MQKTIFLIGLFFISLSAKAQVTLEKEVKITDLAMYFNGKKVSVSDANTTANSPTGYDYIYGRTLTPHGDCIKTYKQYVFMTWYRGGKEDRHVMLTRYNTETGAMKTIEFPHQHTGYRGRWWLGETHNTIAIAISPINGTVHMVYDMHAYTNGGHSVNDYFRYSYSVENAAELPDEEFTLDKFVKDPIDKDYRHTTMDGVRNPRKYDRFTYPQFFLNDGGELFLTARDGTSHDGAQAFIKYNAAAKKWGDFKYLNALGAKSKGETHDWSIYGSIKYVDGKIRAGFQRRLRNGADKYQYQNGVYYAYSDDPTGASQWKNHKGETITFPLVKAEEALVYEPGDYVQATGKNQVSIVGGFDWTVTQNGDVHIVSKVRDKANNVTRNIHSYKPNGASEFIIDPNFSGVEALYTAGNDIFVIGLNGSGRPFVDKATGGTNSFSRIYQQTSGKRFTKGKVYIADGKLYYYLLESKSNNNDDVRTTYLQVIDLNITTEPGVLSVNLATPTNNQTFNEGENVQLFANATADEDQTITKVEFIINDSVLFTDDAAPYTQNWVPTNIGNYSIKVKAYQSDGKTISSNEVSIEIKEIDRSDITLESYRIQNVATNGFLQAGSSSAEPVLMNTTADDTNTHWDFFKTVKDGSEYYNIDSKANGILRATGAAFTAGAYLVVSTTKSPTAQDSDKIWTVHPNETNDIFRFEAGQSGRFMVYDADGKVYARDVPDTDESSLWKLIPTSQALSVQDVFSEDLSIKIYPNPTTGSFTLKMPNSKIFNITIFNVLGSKVYQTTTAKNSIQINEHKKMTAGLYLVKVVLDNNKIYQSKLIVK